MEHNKLRVLITPNGAEFWCEILEGDITTEYFSIESFTKSCAKISEKYPELLSDYISQYREYFNIETSKLTHAGYVYLAKDILRNIPKPIADKLDGMAYDRGHSSGYDEVLSILHGYMWDFKNIFENYNLVNKETGEIV